MYAFISLLLATLTAAAPQPTQIPLKPSPHPRSPLTPRFNRIAHHALDHFHVPGVSVAVVDGPYIFSQGYGHAAFPNVKAKPETLYYTGSTTKSFTAAAFDLLIDDSLDTPNPLSWQTPVSSVLREDFVLPDSYVTEHATFEDLASHRTGMPRHDAAWGGPNVTVRDVVRGLRYLPLTAEFRTTFQYCNMMFIVISHAIETITGVDLGDFLRRRLWHPMGMDNTYFSLSDALRHEEKNLAHGYTWDEETDSYIVEAWPDDPSTSGAGNMISSVLDYAQYLGTMLDRGPPMSPVWHHEIRVARSVPSTEEMAGVGSRFYSLGWEYLSYYGTDVYHHGGNVDGFSVFMAFLPDEDWGVAIFTNSGDRGDYVSLGLFLELVDELLGVPLEDEWDWFDGFDDVIEGEAFFLKHMRHFLYPRAHVPPIHHSRPLLDYRGTYYNPGYRNITLKLSDPAPRIPLRAHPGKMLHGRLEHADVTDLYFEHISSEHWLAWFVEGGRANGTVGDAVRAEFEVGPDGVPARLGIELEEDMDGEKIWFDRVD